MGGPFYLGLDLGSQQDYSALTILESVSSKGGRDIYRHDNLFACRHIQRWPLGTSYPDIVSSVVSILASKPIGGDARLIVDGTGVGVAVVDLFRAAGCAVTSVTITGGSTIAGVEPNLSVPKRDLISSVVVLLQTGRMKFARDLPEVDTLIKELLAYKVTIAANGHDSYANDPRQNPHDDLVLSLCLAAWYAERYDAAQVWI